MASIVGLRRAGTSRLIWPRSGSTPITVVCAGVKSILDVGATLERLETLSVALVGYRTDAFPGFYIRDSGFEVPWRLDSAERSQP